MTRHFSPKRFGSLAAVLALASVASPSLAQGSPANPPQGTVMNGDRYPFVAADVQFLQGMIAHHSQAVAMAKWAPTHGASASLRIYAGRVAMAQTAEIGTMAQWLSEHHQVVPDTAELRKTAGMSGMSMPGMTMDTLMPGMLTPAQMKQLDAAHGVEFDRLFLTFMIQHHTGAIQMVATLFGTNGAGQDDYIFKYANDVQADQTTEINRMQQMLDALPPESGSP